MDESGVRYDYEYAEAWMPRDGDVLEGTVSNIATGISDYGGYPIIEVTKPDGEKRAFHAFHTAARSQLARLKPNRGDKIGIKYLGRQRARNAKRGIEPYANYRIVTEGDGGYDWEREADAMPGGEADNDIPPF